MFGKVQLSVPGEDDMYAFDYYNPSLDTETILKDEGVVMALRTSYGSRPLQTGTIRPLTGRMQTSTISYNRQQLTSSSIRTSSAIVSGEPQQVRPATAVRGAGYTSSGQRSARGAVADQLGQASQLNPSIEVKLEESPEEKISKLERTVLSLVEEACFANEQGDLALALEKAKSAAKREKQLVQQKELLSLGDQVNLDITFLVLLNLACQFDANGQSQEALNIYQILVKNKMFSSASRLRINIGRLLFDQGKYTQAIKQFRVALDQVPSTNHNLRCKITRNIAVAFIKTGQYAEAASALELIVGESADLVSGYNLLVCYQILEESEKARKVFQRLVKIPPLLDDLEKYAAAENHAEVTFMDAIRNDSLRKIELKSKEERDKCIMNAAKLILHQDNKAQDYEWLLECLRSSPFSYLAADLEMHRAMMYLKQRDLNKAIEMLTSFEKRKSDTLSTASVNLSFLYFLMGEVKLAEQAADRALSHDKYNPAAYVSRGNCWYANGNFQQAEDCFREALGLDVTCAEAIYNLGLTLKKLGRLPEALELFTKLNAMSSGVPEVIYQIAVLYDELQDSMESMDWHQQLLSIVPSDPSVLVRLSEIQSREGDKSQAFQYRYEAYKFAPWMLENISWLAGYYVEAQFMERAIEYFEKAILVQPKEVSWYLMIASCFRRTGNYQKALEQYKLIHEKFPDNTECLKFLVRICSDLGLTKDAQDYTTMLKKAEKSRELKAQREVSSGKTKAVGAMPQDTTPYLELEDQQLKSMPSDSRRILTSAGPAPPAMAADPPQFAHLVADSTSRPRTSAGRKALTIPSDDFADADIGDDLLPD